MTTTSNTHFNLIDEPWIIIRPRNGPPREASIRETLVEAEDTRTILGDIPTQAFAIARVLLAICRRAIEWGADPVGTWEEVWNRGSLPMDQIDQYLNRVHSRFDLFAPAAPFYQVTGFQTAAGTFRPVDLLISDIPAGSKYFTTRAGARAERLAFSEAARWVVHCQAFDSSGIKSGDPRDPRTKNGKGYPIGVAWCGQLGGVLFEGRNLFETLMFNTVLQHHRRSTLSAGDLPAWERDDPGVGCREDLTPTGPTDILTWQSRRICLQREGDVVTGVLVGNGDPIDPYNQHTVESMTRWRYSENQSKKAGEPRYYPSQLDPGRALWRGIESLLADLPAPEGKPSPGFAPGVVGWIDQLVNDGILEASLPVRPHALGLQYINQASFVGASIDDELLVHALLLDHESEARVFVTRAVQCADDAVSALAALAGNLAEAAGGDPAGARSTSRAQGFFAIDAPFRRWVANILPDTDYTAAARDWQVEVRNIVAGQAYELIGSAGRPAWKGRLVRDRWLDSALAERYFWAALRKALPSAFEQVENKVGAQ
ncbi:type I-E CRISPR-associated protein Cse1/CasA [Hoyosella sp. YIM 151337]|uniref:type I-E CRISPR-associated protein Cse1/CasA n=1 Tax=Hoyosella sp. YIM 151337 TaxID=2992742 RepID=UPI0022360A05|nr:type I-E CRISPR-associated protein Cse1/CasA [Hoyosella sp. YIM 151337]MCW4353525.1 type I-E CRISPR-associated protein Cse1/CasA [Hoyosella sp. YIM 151337]